MMGPSQWRKAVVPEHFTVPCPFFHVCSRRHHHAPSPRTHILPITLKTVKLSGYITNRRHHAPLPPRTYSSYNPCQCHFSLNTSIHQYFWQCDVAIQTILIDINMSMGPSYGTPRPTGPGATAPAAPPIVTPLMPRYSGPTGRYVHTHKNNRSE